MGNKTKYTPTEAIQAVKGLHRKKLYNMMKNGDISYIKKDTTRWIDASELGRVFGGDFVFDEILETFQGNTLKQIETLEKHDENRQLEVEVSLLRERLKDKDGMIRDKERVLDDVRADRDHWRSQAQTLLLTDQRVKSPEKPVEPQNTINTTNTSHDPAFRSQNAIFGKLGVLLGIIGMVTLLMNVYSVELRKWIDRQIFSSRIRIVDTEKNAKKQSETRQETPQKHSKSPNTVQQSFPPASF